MLVVHPHFHPRRTGVTAHVELVSRAQAAAGAEVRVMGRQVAADLARIGWGELWRRSGREAVVWHAHRNNELLVALLLALLGRSLVIVATYHSQWPGRFSRWLLSFARVVVLLNPRSAAAVPGAHVVPHGIDVGRYAPPERRDEAFAALKLPGRLGVGVIGRVREAKGQGDFVAAIAPLLERFPQCTPVLLGLAKDADVAWARALVEQTKGRLQLLGEQADLRPWLAGLSIVVQPSRSESFSLIVAEAMAAGCCVVGTRTGAIPELIDDGRTGFLVDVGDVVGLRARLEALLAAPEVVERVGRAAREAAVASFGVEREAKALLALYEAAARAR